LKTPIAAIIGAADTLKEEKDKLTVKNREELIDDISEASLRLNQQVENLLNMSRLESGRMQLKKDWCDMNELIHSILQRLEVQLRNYTVHLNIEENLPLYKLDHFLIEQSVYNLLYNAAVYTPEHSEIFIIIRNNCERNFALLSTAGEPELVNEVNELVLIIEDRGPGFPEAEIGKVFDKFYRLENTKPGGTGLGLSIVKGFIEAHDGRVELENVPHGARFTITVPAEVSFLNNLKNE
jgi:two-component system sensor histidine kinase KdpD